MSPGPRVRTDIVDAYLFRRRARRVEVLQLRRAAEPLKGTWQPVMGHARPGETAIACLWREVREETDLRRGGDDLLGAWALQQVHPYFVAALDALIMSPRFAIEVSPTWQPRLNREHDAARWVDARRPGASFMWPGQALAVRDIPRLDRPRGACRVGLALDLTV